MNIQPHKAPRSSLYSPPRSSLCSSAAPTSRDFEIIFRIFARRSTYFFRRHHHINLLGNQSTPTYDCGTDVCLCAFVAMLLTTPFIIFHKAESQITGLTNAERTRAPCNTSCSFESEV